MPITYNFYFEIFDTQVMLYGIVMGLGAVLGNIAGKKLLGKISLLHFRRLVIIVMVVSGVILLVRSLYVLMP